MSSTFSLNDAAQIGLVSLNVANLKKVTDFYQQIVGLEILQANSEVVSLGIQATQQTLVILNHKPKTSHQPQQAGLYHSAFLLPERRDLGNLLYRLLAQQIPLVGAADHGYSEAIYLEDPEGNGVEVYWDKPKKAWDIRLDGSIVGITAELDVNGVLASRDQELISSLPPKTRVGHVHLSVADLEETNNFYTQILGFDLAYRFGRQADFFAVGGYHHQIAANTWHHASFRSSKEDGLGLAYFSIVLPNQATLLDLQAHLTKEHIPFSKTETGLLLTDPSGLTIWVLAT